MARRRNNVLDCVGFAFARSVLFVLEWTPECIVYPTLDGLGRLLSRCVPSRQRIAMANLRIAFGDSKSERELARIATRSWGSVFMVLADVAKSARYVRAGRFLDRVEGASRTRDGLPLPLLLCTPHLGSWEVAGTTAGSFHRGMHVIARPLGNPMLQRYLVRQRSLLGQNIHPRRGGIRHLLAALRAGQAVASLPDQNQRLRPIFVPYFGRLASADRSQARLAQMTGAMVFVGAALRIGRRFRFRFLVADTFHVQDGPEQIVETTARIHRAIESLVSQYPEQYFWLHNRYRTRPPEEAGQVNGNEGKKRSA